LTFIYINVKKSNFTKKKGQMSTSDATGYPTCRQQNTQIKIAKTSQLQQINNQCNSRKPRNCMLAYKD